MINDNIKAKFKFAFPVYEECREYVESNGDVLDNVAVYNYCLEHHYDYYLFEGILFWLAVRKEVQYGMMGDK